MSAHQLEEMQAVYLDSGQQIGAEQSVHNAHEHGNVVQVASEVLQWLLG